MKHLSYILALWVLLLSTVPCFLEDKCLFQCANEQTEEPCADNDGSSCTDCNCSPFLHCNTCTGCPIPKLFHSESFHFILAMAKAAIDPIVKLNINDTEQTINELSIAIPKFPLTHA